MIALEIRGACPHDCPDTCGVITTVKEGRAIAFRGDPANPITEGWLCAKVRPYLDHVYHPDRLTHPLRRSGPKGSGQWKRISWQEAIGEITDRWKAISAESGAEAILPYSYSGTLGFVQLAVASGRFWNRLGATQLQRGICGAAAEHAVEATLGRRISAPYDEVAQSKLVILWGHNPVSTAPHFMPFLTKARNNGTRVIVIDPRRTPSCNGAEKHLMPIPGSDGPLALGMAHVIVRENLHDEAWLNANTVGWPRLKERIAEYPPSRAATMTGLPEKDILELARVYASTKPSLIKIADGINRNVNGGQNVRAILALPALTGQYGTTGGGLGYSTSGYVKWDKDVVHKILPTTRAVSMNRLGAVLLGEATNPPIRSLFVFGANPATSSPAASKIVEGMKRDDLFTVVHELFMTDTAELADIVLPATSQLEQIDLHKGYGTTLLTYNAPAIAPLGESKSNWEVMGLLARGMGFTEDWLYQSPDDIIREVLAAMAATDAHFQGITLERLKAEGFVHLNLKSTTPFADLKFPTPSGKVELYCQALADQGHDPLPGRFREVSSEEETLILVSGASHHFVSSSLASQTGLLKQAGPPFVEIHPDDATRRGITEGDMVELVNERGLCRLRAVVTDGVRQGVVVSPKGRWAKLSGGTCVNGVTSDELGDFAGQSTFHSTRVRLRRAQGE